jgi:hypothetical protein
VVSHPFAKGAKGWGTQQLIQFMEEVVFDQVEQVRLIGRSGDAVGFVGVDHEVELLAGFDQGFNHLDAVLEMDVVVTGAVEK